MGRGQAVPILIIAIAILMFIYVYFLPIDEKCKLIPGLPDCKVSEAGKMLSVVPGLLEEQETSARYLLPDVDLFRKETVDVSTVFENAEVSKSWFYSGARQASMPIQENGKSVKLFIFVNKAKGDLNVYINGQKASTIRGEGVHEIKLDISRLHQTNTIKIVPSTPLIPFVENKYIIGKAVLREEYVLTQNRVSLPLNITQDPADIKDIKLSFKTNCFTAEPLAIYLNDNKLVEERICEGINRDITSELMRSRMTGNITFASEGSYSLKNILVNVRMKERSWPTYYFSVSEKRLERQIMLALSFNQTGMKKMTAYINGQALSVETTKKEWQTVINKYLVKGQNSIMLLPEQTVEVALLEVRQL